MLYPQNIEQKLGFDQIRQLLRNECLSPLGQFYVDKIRFSYDFDLITKLTEQTHEFRKILSQNLAFPTQNYIDSFPFLEKLRPEGAFLSPEEFRDLKVSLKAIAAVIEFLDKAKEEEFKHLKQLRQEVEVDKAIFSELERIIDDRGDVKDTASDELGSIRRRIISEQGRIRKELDSILRRIKKEGFADEEVTVTIRNGRMVVPVSAEHKRKVRGFVHDESATGQTVFIEPAEVLEINNEIRELEYEERREVVRILTVLASFIRPYLVPLRKAYTFLGLIDFIRAKAKLALKMDAVLPAVENKTVVNWVQARHPLLYLSFQQQQKHVVPLNIRLTNENRVLVISGPNAGGKSVCLKTTGLVQYMFQCGLLVPVNEGSVMGVFQDIFIDIGDEQSLENDLSTYSSHLKNMKHFVNFAGSKSLVLIDEFGTGTEPQFGGAIAEAVLEKFNELQCFGVITTHYSNLKSYAERTPGVINGSMRFDVQKLEPLYELEIGRPGSSFAFEIATKIGLPREVIASSKSKIGTSEVDFDKMLREVELEKNKLRESNIAAKNKQNQLDQLIKKYSEENQFIEENRKQLLKEAKQQAKSLLQEANKKIEATIRGIKEVQADKEITKDLRQDLEGYQQKIEKELDKEEHKETNDYEVLPGEVKEGDYVRVKETGAMGEVVSIKGKEAEILIGELKSNVKLKRLEKISRKEYRSVKGSESSIPATRGLDMVEKFSGFSPNLDLRGKRGEEALKEVDMLIDNALLFGAHELRIVHGKGDGILRTLVRNRLKSYSYVKSMEDEHADRGGSGVTIVRMK